MFPSGGNGLHSLDVAEEASVKYGSRRTWVEVLGRWFPSRAEALRAIDLHLMERGGLISDLQFQVPFTLCPGKKITIDFKYVEDGKIIYEDVKGVITRDFKTKLLWLKDKYGIDVRLVDKNGMILQG